MFKNKLQQEVRMNYRDMIETAVDNFRENLTNIADSLEDTSLTPDSLCDLSRGLLEASAEASRGFLREYLQSEDVVEDVIERNGKRFRYKDTSGRKFMTFLGPIRIERSLYQQDHGGRAFFPLDEKCGIHGFYATRDVRDACLFLAGTKTPKEVEQTLQKTAIFNPSATAIQNMVIHAGETVEAEGENLFDEVRREETAPAGTKVLAGSLDGANVLLNEPGKKAGRPAERPGKEESGDASPSSYRNAMVGSITFYGDVPEDGKGPDRLQSRYVAQMPEEGFPTMRSRFEAELAHAEAITDDDVIKVLLFDGARPLWNYVESSEIFDEYEKILDYLHATEHLSKAGEAIFGKSSGKARKWYERWCGKLLEKDNATDGLVRSMDRYAGNLPEKRREELERQRTYFVRNARMMRYAEYRRRGLPVGSGVVEAACKTIVKQRLCRSGMRWSREGGQHVLHLCSVIKSGRWDSFWKAVSKAEEKRNIQLIAA